MKIVGIQRNVVFRMDGKEFTGINLFGIVPRDNVDGHATEKIFVNSTKECYATACSLKVGDEINCYYNRFGKVDTIVPAKG